VIHRCRIGIRRAGQYNDIVCTTDTDSDISRIVCESKQRAVSYSRPRIAPATTENTVMFLPCYRISFSEHRFFDVPGPIFAKLCHTTRYVLKYFMSYTGVHMCLLKNLRGENPLFCRFTDPKSILLATPFHNAREIGISKTIVAR